MKDFDYYLNLIGEIGFVDEVKHSLVYVSGIPKAHLREVVIFENGDLGEVFSIEEDKVEILLLTTRNINVGTKLARTGEFLKVSVGNGLLGRMINPLGLPSDLQGSIKDVQLASIDKEP